jgi:ABC-type proline/glycine betaine transport system ATPase subunit
MKVRIKKQFLYDESVVEETYHDIKEIRQRQHRVIGRSFAKQIVLVTEDGEEVISLASSIKNMEIILE